MNISEAVQFLAEEAKKSATAFDIIGGHSKSEGVSVFQGKVQNTEISESVGVGIRAFKGVKPGYAYTERLTERSSSNGKRRLVAYAVHQGSSD